MKRKTKKPVSKTLHVRTGLKAGPARRTEDFGDFIGNYNQKVQLSVDEDGFIVNPD